MAKLGFKFKPKNKNREAVPNVVIVNPSIDYEYPTNKRSTSKESCCSAAILGRAESEVRSLYIKTIAMFSNIKFNFSDTFLHSVEYFSTLSRVEIKHKRLDDSVKRI